MNNIIIKKILVTIAFMTTIYGCRRFECSPYETENRDRPENLNQFNIAKLLAKESTSDDTVTILYIGDSHRFYNELNGLVKHANTLSNVDFLILAGDITDFGVLEQYLTIYNILNKLKIPYISVIGNHDLTANGGKIYLQMFGQKNFSFIYKGYKFLFHDTNGREYDFSGSVPNLFWLTDQLKDDKPKWFVGVSHVPPFDEDFDNTLELPYKDLLLSIPNFILSLHAHTHYQSDCCKYDDRIRYMTCNSVEKQKSCILKLINGKVMMQMIPY